MYHRDSREGWIHSEDATECGLAKDDSGFFSDSDSNKDDALWEKFF
jgi:hypothetical protein